MSFIDEFDPISLILVAHNEALTIEREILSLHRTIVSKISGSEFVVAEDGSTDGTTEIIKGLAEGTGIIHLGSKKRRGYAKALLEAVRSARSEYIFFSDSGLKYDPEDFWKLYRVRKKYDLIVGRRVNRQDQPYRKFLTYSYNLFVRIFFGLRNVCDADGGFRLFNRRVVEKVFEKELTFDQLIGSEVVVRSILGGLRYCEIPVSYSRRMGVSRGLPPKKIPRVIFQVLKDMKRLKHELMETPKVRA